MLPFRPPFRCLTADGDREEALAPPIAPIGRSGIAVAYNRPAARAQRYLAPSTATGFSVV